MVGVENEPPAGFDEDAGGGVGADGPALQHERPAVAHRRRVVDLAGGHRDGLAQRDVEALGGGRLGRERQAEGQEVPNESTGPDHGVLRRLGW